MSRNGSSNSVHEFETDSAGVDQNDRESYSRTSPQEILQARARLLAKSQSSETVEETIEVAEFLLGPEGYAFELDYLREVCPLADVTYIPCAPPFVVGVINLRGLIIPIIDILSFLNVSKSSVPVFNKAVILQSDKLIIGLLADEVVGARRVPISGLQSLGTLRGLASDYLKGVTKDRLVILDAGKILTDPRLLPDAE